MHRGSFFASINGELAKYSFEGKLAQYCIWAENQMVYTSKFREEKCGLNLK
jgi:hypothetical protein